MSVRCWKRSNKIAAAVPLAGARQVNKARFFAVLALAVFAAQNAIFMVPPLLVEISSDLDISVALAGQLATATFAAWGLSVVSVGPLSDSFGRRPVALAGLLLLTVSVVASAFAPNIWVFLVLRVLTGLGGGTLPPNAVGAITEVISPAKRAQAIGALLGISMLSQAISIPLVALLAEWVGWRFAFTVASILLAAGFLTNWFWFPRGSTDWVRDLVIFARYRSLISMHYFHVALTVNVTHRIAFWSIVSFFAAYLIRTYDVNVGFVALPLGIAAIGQVMGSYGGGFVASHRSRALIIAAVSVSGGVCGLLFFTLPLDVWVAVALAAVGTGLLSIPFPALVAGSTEYSGESKATGVGLMGLSNQSGGVLGGAIAGVLLANLGYGAIGYLCLGATVFSALIATAFGSKLRQGRGDS